MEIGLYFDSAGEAENLNIVFFSSFYCEILTKRGLGLLLSLIPKFPFQKLS